MRERETRLFFPLPVTNHVDDLVLNWLVQNDKMPRDALVKAEIEGRRRGDDDRGEHYREALNEVVLACLEGGEEPEFLAAPYPDVFSLYIAADWVGKNSLGMLSDDFHKLGTLYRLAQESEINPNTMYTVWHRLITEIDPTFGLWISDEGFKTNYWYHRLSYAVIKDEPAYEAYCDEGVQKRLRVGIGKNAIKPLGFLLADNHPELFEVLDLN